MENYITEKQHIFMVLNDSSEKIHFIYVIIKPDNEKFSTSKKNSSDNKFDKRERKRKKNSSNIPAQKVLYF